MQTIVITGSTRGIGKGLAREFLETRSPGSGHRPQPGSSRWRSCRTGQSRSVLGCVCDVRDMASLEAVWAAAVARFGRVDIWISNAAVATDRALLADLPVEQIVATIETNLLGTIYGTKVALAGMLRQGGGKIYTFEGFGSNGMMSPGLTTYGSSKYGLRYFTRSLAKEYKDSPVLIGALSPGMVPTDLLLYSSKSKDAAEWQKAKRVMNILGDTVETVTPWLAAQALANQKQGACIEWLTPQKAALRFATAAFRKRDIISPLEARTDHKVR